MKILLLLLFSLPSLAVPELFIETSAPVDSKKVSVPGTFTLDNLSGSLEIRGRGNTTWGFPKKPYKIDLTEKTPLLGLPAAKDWVLLANFSDKTLLRNALALDFARQLQPFTPKAKPVDVTLNREYVGSYLLTEQIEIGPNRLNLTKLKKTDIEGEALTGAYLIESSERLNEPFSFRTTRGRPFMLKNPSNPEPAQRAYIQGYLQAAEDALFSPDFAGPEGYAKFFEVKEFIHYYLVNELFRNQDAALYDSIFFHKDRGGKLVLGPVWDFDISAGNINYDDNFLTDGWWIRKKSPWFARLVEDPAFAQAVHCRWREIRGKEVEHLLAQIDVKAAELAESQNRNFTKWPILDEYIWPNYVWLGTYENEVKYLKNWLRVRIRWLDSQWPATEACAKN